MNNWSSFAVLPYEWYPRDWEKNLQFGRRRISGGYPTKPIFIPIGRTLSGVSAFESKTRQLDIRRISVVWMGGFIFWWVGEGGGCRRHRSNQSSSIQIIQLFSALRIAVYTLGNYHIQYLYLRNRGTLRKGGARRYHLLVIAKQIILYLTFQGGFLRF